MNTMELGLLQNTTTLFVYRDGDKPHVESLQKTLSEAWTYTPLEFISYDDYQSNVYEETYSFLTLGYTHRVKESETGANSFNTHFFLSLWRPKGEERVNYARIEMHPDRIAYGFAYLYAEIEEQRDTIVQVLYQSVPIKNWHISYLKNALQYTQHKLKAKESRGLYTDEKHDQLGYLKRYTLYVPDYCLEKYIAVKGNEPNRHDPSKLFAKYPYKYKIIPKEELDQLIMTADKPIYYLSYIKSSTMKFVNVLNSKTGELLYSESSTLSYNLKDKDLTRLAKAVKK